MMDGRRIETVASRLTARHLSRRTAVAAGLGTVAASLGLTAVRGATLPGTQGPLPTGVTLVAHGLLYPRGFTWGADGTLYVGLAGNGGSSPGTPALAPPEGPLHGGTTASIVKIVNGAAIPVARGLPSVLNVSGGTAAGVAAIAFLGNQLYALIAGGGSIQGNPQTPNGIYAVQPDGSARVLFNLSAWLPTHPTAVTPPDAPYEPDGSPFAMIALDGALWTIESNRGQVLRVTPEGAVTRVADLSRGHPVPTGIAAAPGGGVYVGFLTPGPYFDGSSKVVNVAPDGAVTEVWSGLTMVTALAVAPDGMLYALEMATGNTPQPPGIHPNTGKVVRRTGPHSLADVATGLDFPIAMAFGPDHGLYVAVPAQGPNGTDGRVLRLDVSTGRVLSLAGTPPASPPAATPGVAPATSGAAPATITIVAGDFFFKPNAVTIPANTPVTIKVSNHGAITHNFSIDALKVSIYMQPGQTAQTTITAPPGSYQFYCNLPGHKAAGMVGTLTAK